MTVMTSAAFENCGHEACDMEPCIWGADKDMDYEDDGVWGWGTTCGRCEQFFPVRSPKSMRTSAMRMRDRFLCWLLGHSTADRIGDGVMMPRLGHYRCPRCGRTFWQYGSIDVQIADDDPRLSR